MSRVFTPAGLRRFGHHRQRAKPGGNLFAFSWVEDAMDRFHAGVLSAFLRSESTLFAEGVLISPVLPGFDFAPRLRRKKALQFAGR